MSKLPQPPDGPTGIATPKFNRGFKSFFSEVGREMRKVNWPPRSETTRLTGIVLAVCGMVLLMLFALNWAFNHAMNFLMNQKGSI